MIVVKIHNIVYICLIIGKYMTAKINYQMMYACDTCGIVYLNDSFVQKVGNYDHICVKCNDVLVYNHDTKTFQ